MALGRLGQGEQLAPHEFTLLFGAHMVGPVVGQAWKPLLHEMPQVGGLPVQVGPPLGGSVQTVQLLPHEVTLVLLLGTHVVPHRW